MKNVFIIKAKLGLVSSLLHLTYTNSTTYTVNKNTFIVKRFSLVR